MGIFWSPQQEVSAYVGYVPQRIGRSSFWRVRRASNGRPDYRHQIAIYRYFDHFLAPVDGAASTQQHRDQTWEVLYRESVNSVNQEWNG